MKKINNPIKKWSKQRNKMLFEEINSGNKDVDYRQKLPGAGKLFKDSPWIDRQSSMNVGSV